MKDGLNPVNNQVLPEDSIVRDENVKRCFEYIVSLLEHRLLQNTKIKKVKKINKASSLIIDKRDYPLIIEDDLLQITSLVSKINNVLNPEAKVIVRRVSDWLLDHGYLEQSRDEQGNSKRLPSESGENIGIITILEISNDILYKKVKYNNSSQEFILDHINEIMHYKRSNDSKAKAISNIATNDYIEKQWSLEEKELLLTEFNFGMNVEELAETHKCQISEIQKIIDDMGDKYEK
jgi:chemotaxis signal transduction protein